MSESSPEVPDPQVIIEKSIDFSHQQERSLTGSGQYVGIEPSDDFVPPSMAMDSYKPESDG